MTDFPDWIVERKIERLTEPCDCYECVGEKLDHDGKGRVFVKNNLKKHTLLEPCEECGRPKTEYLDLGRKGYYVCWWCRDRSEPPEVSP